MRNKDAITSSCMESFFRIESVVFSNIEVRVKRAGPSGLGDLEVTEYIAHIRSGPFERKDGTSVHQAKTEAKFMPD